MGVKITELLKISPAKVEDLSGRIIAIDSPMFLYQFLTSIRQMDGTPLMDSKGNITSHLVGLLSRTAWICQSKIKPVFVFDGKPPELKIKEIEKRTDAKLAAKKMFEEAEKEKDIEGMAKYSKRMVKLTREMISEAKELVNAFGLPYVEAPSEAEAQAAKIVADGKAWAVASQDADSLLFGAAKLVRNISSTQRKKQKGRLGTEEIQIEIIDLKETLNELDISRQQLIAIGMLIGTDYNNKGIPGIGPKNALKIVKKHSSIQEIFKEVEWDKHFEVPWKKVYDLFEHPHVTGDYSVDWKTPNYEKAINLLVEKHDFSKERVMASLEKIKPAKESQKGLGSFF